MFAVTAMRTVVLGFARRPQQACHLPNQPIKRLVAGYLPRSCDFLFRALSTSAVFIACGNLLLKRSMLLNSSSGGRNSTPVKGSFSSEAVRSFSTISDAGTGLKPEKLQLARLTTRAVVKVHGRDSAEFLQGLITNDIHLLDASEDGGPRTIYTLMLNLQGRIVFDLFISRTDTHADGFLVDCDATMKEKLIKHLKLYKLRKDVAVELEKGLSVYASFPEFSKAMAEAKHGDYQRLIHKSTGSAALQVHDPRLTLLGYRTVTGASDFNPEKLNMADEFSYCRFRYQMGVPEGCRDLPPGECFPAESNADYLSGVHFHKGCYLGQELTARTHHTGVVRKRLMPVVIDGLADGVDLPGDSAVMAKGVTRPVGKLRAHCGKYGLALLRIKEALAADVIWISHEGRDLGVTTRRPSWWPESDVI